MNGSRTEQVLELIMTKKLILEIDQVTAQSRQEKPKEDVRERYGVERLIAAEIAPVGRHGGRHRQRGKRPG